MRKVNSEMLVIVSDIHANFNLLQKFSSLIEKSGISCENVYILGDIVHEGNTDDDECLDLIRKKRYNAVRGNHEDDILKKRPIFDVPKLMRYRRISQDNLQYLHRLPENISVCNVMLSHSVPGESYSRLYNKNMAQKIFDSWPSKTSVIFIGHSHVENSFCHDLSENLCSEILDKGFTIRDNKRYLINLGLFADNGCFILYDTYFKRITRTNVNGL